MRKPRTINNTRKCEQIIYYIFSIFKKALKLIEIQIIIYFIEMNYYQINEDRLLGLTFKKKENGPFSHILLLVIENMVLNHQIAQSHKGYYLIDDKTVTLSDNEKDIVDSILKKLSGFYSDEDILTYVNRDPPMLTCALDNFIDPKSVFYRDVVYDVSGDYSINSRPNACIQKQ